MTFDPITCHGQSWGNYCLVCEDELLEQHTKENSIEREYDNEMCSECGFYLWDADSVPLNNCKTCERVKV
jgi:hypothetical protein